MGLDMYFTARRYLWSFPEDGPDSKLGAQIKQLFPDLPENAKFKNIEVEFGYWRKANAIHNWFVQNVQEGKDECQETYVSDEDIQKLLDTVNKVLADTSLAPSLLPTASGFFFGGTEYNEWYWRDLEYTKELCERALDPKMKGWDFYYQSSW
jgi:hypothetical protein